MNDNAMMALLISTINSGLSAMSISVGLQQSQQPTLQGTPSTDTVYIFKLSENRYGFPGRSDVWNSGTSQMEHTEKFILERTYQISALAIQNPADTTRTTASDYVRAVGQILQSDATAQTLDANSPTVGILRIRPVRIMYFKDDFDNFEASPSLDFTVTNYESFTQVINSTDNVIGTVTEFS